MEQPSQLNHSPTHHKTPKHSYTTPTYLPKDASCRALGDTPRFMMPTDTEQGQSKPLNTLQEPHTHSSGHG
ncbi:hypothetical protein E2C01_076205 [Portunus trituberculatus]|uniref:Uncharacterized protein n=1 Tax=Portunus trituberculatus TaxID=210409 RepID=A0A5B7IAU0_PORTR|nr:hypothetical protein [Portunus trituberculatus]